MFEVSRGIPCGFDRTHLSVYVKHIAPHPGVGLMLEMCIRLAIPLEFMLVFAIDVFQLSESARRRCCYALKDFCKRPQGRRICRSLWVLFRNVLVLRKHIRCYCATDISEPHVRSLPRSGLQSRLKRRNADSMQTIVLLAHPDCGLRTTAPHAPAALIDAIPLVSSCRSYRTPNPLFT
jgi:hypothetical protein